MAARTVGPSDVAESISFRAVRSEEEKECFLDFQFGAQHDYYREQFPDARFDLVLVDGEPAGRLYVHRREDEIRLIDIALPGRGRNPQHRSRRLAQRADSAT